MVRIMKYEDNGYLSGIIGALIGGIIATIPWLIVYFCLNYMIAVLAIFIAMGALKGYKVARGKVDKKLPWIICIVSLIAMSFAMLVVLPNIVLLKEGAEITLANFKLIYSESEIFSALIRDFIISILFTIIGISGVVSTVKTQIANGEEVDAKIFNSNLTAKNRKAIKDFFIRNNALSKETAISKDVILASSEVNEQCFNIMVAQNQIVKEEERYYFSKKNERRPIIIALVIVFVIIIFTSIFAFSSIDSEEPETKDEVKEVESNDKKEEDRELIFDRPDGYKEYVENETGITYIYVPTSDISGDSGFISVTYGDDFTVAKEDSEAFIENLREGLKSDYGIANSTITSYEEKEYWGIYITYSIDEYREDVYYLFYEDRYALVDAMDFFTIEDNTIMEDAKEISKSIKWNSEK